MIAFIFPVLSGLLTALEATLARYGGAALVRTAYRASLGFFVRKAILEIGKKSSYALARSLILKVMDNYLYGIEKQEHSKIKSGGGLNDLLKEAVQESISVLGLAELATTIDALTEFREHLLRDKPRLTKKELADFTAEQSQQFDLQNPNLTTKTDYTTDVFNVISDYSDINMLIPVVDATLTFLTDTLGYYQSSGYFPVRMKLLRMTDTAMNDLFHTENPTPLFRANISQIIRTEDSGFSDNFSAMKEFGKYIPVTERTALIKAQIAENAPRS